MKPSITDQEIFDIAAKHILKQREPSVVGDGGNCRYKHENPATGKVLGCAMAPFIEDYDIEMEGKGFSWVISRWPEKITHQFEDRQNMIVTRLQCCHDGASRSTEFMLDFKRKMRKLAKSFRLDDSVLEEE